MPESPWRTLIVAAASSRPVPVGIATVLGPVRGASKGARVRCSDGRLYVVKGTQVGRALVADHVVGRLGTAMGAPVPEVGLVNVPAEFVEEETFTLRARGFVPGVGHGSVLARKFDDGWDVEHIDAPGNRERFALLAALYGLALEPVVDLVCWRHGNANPHALPDRRERR